MIERKIAIENILTKLSNKETYLVSALGRISRDIYSMKNIINDHCFYCLGSMGNVIPFTLGLSLSYPNKKFVAIEGDGSLLMCLGALVTLKRYSGSNISIIIIDNKSFESTGGQSSQPKDFELTSVVKSIIPETYEISTLQEIHLIEKNIFQTVTPSIYIIKCSLQSPSPRIDLSPTQIKNNFLNSLNK